MRRGRQRGSGFLPHCPSFSYLAVPSPLRPHRYKHVQLTDVGILGLSEPLPETVLVPRFPDLYL